MVSGRIDADESAILRRELETLRAERQRAATSTASSAVSSTERSTASGEGAGVQASPDAGADTGSEQPGWDDVGDLARSLAEEVEHLAGQRPLLGLLGAFVLGLVIGHATSR